MALSDQSSRLSVRATQAEDRAAAAAKDVGPTERMTSLVRTIPRLHPNGRRPQEAPGGSPSDVVLHDALMEPVSASGSEPSCSTATFASPPQSPRHPRKDVRTV